MVSRFAPPGAHEPLFSRAAWRARALRDAFADACPTDPEPSDPSADACSTHSEPYVESNPTNVCSHSNAHEIADKCADAGAHATNGSPQPFPHPERMAEFNSVRVH